MDTKDLQLGDVVSPIERQHPFDTCIVRHIYEGYVTLFRPYGHPADFSYTGGVICYTGTEEYSVSVDDTRYSWTLHTRSTLR